MNWKKNGTEILHYLNATADSRVYQYTWTYGTLQKAWAELYFREGRCRNAGNYTCESSVGDYVERAHVEVKCK